MCWLCLGSHVGETPTNFKDNKREVVMVPKSDWAGFILASLWMVPCLRWHLQEPPHPPVYRAYESQGWDWHEHNYHGSHRLFADISDLFNNDWIHDVRHAVCWRCFWRTGYTIWLSIRSIPSTRPSPACTWFTSSTTRATVGLHCQ